MEEIFGLVMILCVLGIWILGTQKVFKQLGTGMGVLFAAGLPGLTVLFSLAGGGGGLLVPLPMLAWIWILRTAVRKEKEARKNCRKLEELRDRKGGDRIQRRECGGSTFATAGKENRCDLCGAPVLEGQTRRMG